MSIVKHLSNPLVLIGFIVAAVYGVLHLAGVPTLDCQRFLAAEALLLAIAAVAEIVRGFAVRVADYRFDRLTWTYIIYSGAGSIYDLSSFLFFLGWPLFGAGYAIYYWLNN